MRAIGPLSDVLTVFPRKFWSSGDEFEIDEASLFWAGGDGMPLDDANPGEGELRERKETLRGWSATRQE